MSEWVSGLTPCRQRRRRVFNGEIHVFEKNTTSDCSHVNRKSGLLCSEWLLCKFFLFRIKFFLGKTL